MKITDPLIELLAIKLYEHDAQSGSFPPKTTESYTNWMKLDDDDRQIYRDIANGKRDLP